MIRVCSKCKISKTLDCFYKHSTSPDGVRSVCIQCDRPLKRKWKKDNSEKVLNSHLKREFGIDLVEFNKILKEQDNACAICRKNDTFGEKNKRLSVDHDHKTGKVRGLLCVKCNTALGSFKDDPALLQSAIDYLAKHKSCT